jgi:hypothetical protein
MDLAISYELPELLTDYKRKRKSTTEAKNKKPADKATSKPK